MFSKITKIGEISVVLVKKIVRRLNYNLTALIVLALCFGANPLRISSNYPNLLMVCYSIASECQLKRIDTLYIEIEQMYDYFV